MIGALNKKNYLTFAKQVRGAGISHIEVRRQDGKKNVRLRYFARDPKSGRRFNGEWVLPADEARETAEAAFFELAEKDFAVTRHEE